MVAQVIPASFRAPELRTVHDGWERLLLPVRPAHHPEPASMLSQQPVVASALPRDQAQQDRPEWRRTHPARLANLR